MTRGHRIFFAFLFSFFALVLSVGSVFAIDGVPHLEQNYNKTVLQWWDYHPYNPDTKGNNYIPVGSITNSGPQVDVCSQSGSNARDKVKTALSKIPKSGGTLVFRKSCSPYDLTSGLEWITNLYKSDFPWVNGGVNVDISDYNNLHMVADQPGTVIKGSFHIHSTAHVGSSCRHDPVQNFYFKNLTFNDPGNKHLAFIFEDTEDILFDNVTFNSAGLLTVIKGNNFFFRDSTFNNGPLHFDGTQFAGIVNSQINLDFSNHVGVYSNPYWVDFHQNNDATCDGDKNGTLDIYEERFPKYFAVDGNNFTHKSGKAPVILGAVKNAIFQSNNIQGSISDFVKIHSDSRPNPKTGKYYTYTDYKLISNTISNADTLLNMDLSSRQDGGSFTRGDVTIAYTNGTSLGKLLNGSAGSNLVMCGNKINGSFVDGSTCSNLDPQGGPSPAPSPSPTTPASPIPGLGEFLTNFSVSSSNSYVWQALDSSRSMYTDRPYQFTSVPSEYQGAYYLQTANDDKQTSAASNLINFTAAKDITVYVAYTTVNNQITNWLSGWNTNNPAINSDLSGNEANRLVASKSFSAGQTVTLKGNGGTSATTSMYNVLVKADEGSSCSLEGDLNNDGVVDGTDYAALGNSFLSSGAHSADINGDQVVDGTDYALMANNFLQSCSLSTSPSPSPISSIEPGSARLFSQLPSNVRDQLGRINPRKTINVSDSPFGTHTTTLKEGHEANNIPFFLGMVSDAGYKWIKDYFGSNQVSSSSPATSYWNTFPDRYYEYFQEADRLGFKIFIRLDFPRVDGRIPTTSSDMEYVRRFYKRAAEEFGQYVDDWEIDNEPNLRNSSGNPWISEAQYENIAAVAAQAIREGDPGAKVYGPATAMLQAMADTPTRYIPDVINEGLLNHIDVFSYHPYRQPYKPFRYPELASEFEPWNRWGTYSNQLAALRTMVKNKPLAVTEMGYPTNFNRSTGERDISLLTQAKYEQRSMLMDYSLDVRPTINFIFKRPFANDSGDALYELEYHFNIVDPDNSKKPIFYAVQNLTAIVDDDLQKAPFSVSCSGNTTDLQIQTYTRSTNSAYDEVAILIWDAVAAEDNNHQRGTCTMTVNSQAYEGYAFYDLLGQYPTALELNFSYNNGKTTISNIPVQDSPGLVRGVRVK